MSPKRKTDETSPLKTPRPRKKPSTQLRRTSRVSNEPAWLKSVKKTKRTYGHGRPHIHDGSKNESRSISAFSVTPVASESPSSSIQRRPTIKIKSARPALKAEEKAVRRIPKSETYDPEKQWPARAILAEKGGRYLVAWCDDGVTGEAYEPTWEPKANVGVGIVAMWKRDQEAQAEVEAVDKSRIQNVFDEDTPNRTPIEEVNVEPESTMTNTPLQDGAPTGETSLEKQDTVADEKSMGATHIGQTLLHNSNIEPFTDDGNDMASSQTLKSPPPFHQISIDDQQQQQQGIALPEIETSKRAVSATAHSMIDPSLESHRPENLLVSPGPGPGDAEAKLAKDKTPQVEPELEDEEEQWEVRAIIGEDRRRYLLDWLPHPTTGEEYEPSWEHKSNVGDALKATWKAEKLARKQSNSLKDSASPLSKS